MGKAEVGTPKYIANKMKSKGLQRLRWYCQVCEKQCRDENGFKCHTQSQTHVNNMLSIGSNAKSKINEYSTQFQRDFVSLLSSSHGEKPINYNRFYQEYISDKNHLHMNATKWSSLSDFVHHLARESIIHIKDSEKDGLLISWIDNSPQALERKNILLKRQQRENSSNDTDQKELEHQILLAHKQQQQQPQESGPKQLLENKGKLSLSINSTPNNNNNNKVAKRSNPLIELQTSKSKISKPNNKPPSSTLERIMLRDKQRVHSSSSSSRHKI